MRAQGFKLKQIWVDAEGFPGKAGAGFQEVRPSLSVAELSDELVRLTKNMDGDFTLKLCGELYACARGIKALWDDARTSQYLPGLGGDTEDEKEGDGLPF
jgi:hypothetical protein